MRVFTTITPVYLELVQHWLISSIKAVEPCISVHLEVFDDINCDGNFGTEGFKDHNRQKAEAVARWIRQYDGDIIFVCDADIIFLRPFQERITAELGNHDLAISAEALSGGYNIGQVAVRCSERVAQFYDEVVAMLIGEAWDQELVNSMLPKTSLRHRSLSPFFANTGIWRDMGAESRARLYSYHATDSLPTDSKSSIFLKNELINEVLGRSV